MRSQEKAIFDSIAGGALHVAIPYLTQAEAISIAKEASRILGGDTSKFTRNALEGWFRLGILKEPVRTDRNRLFAITDVFRVAAVLHLSTCGLRLELCRAAAEMLDDEWIDQHFESAAKSLDTELLKIFDVSAFLVLATEKSHWLITWYLDLEQLAIQTKLSAGVILLNAAGLFDVTVRLSRHTWEKKAEKFLAKADSDLAKSKLRESK